MVLYGGSKQSNLLLFFHLFIYLILFFFWFYFSFFVVLYGVPKLSNLHLLTHLFIYLILCSYILLIILVSFFVYHHFLHFYKENLVNKKYSLFMAHECHSKICNPVYNIVELVDILINFPLATSETERDY